MLPEPGALLAVVLLGGWITIDGTAFGQFMVSRPLVASALAGWAVGQPAAGAALGVVLEAFDLGVLPVGASRYPEGGPAAVAAAAVFAGGELTTHALLTAIVFFLVWERVCGETVHLQRQANHRVLSSGTGEPGDASVLERRHLTALALDFARGMLLVGTGMLVLATLIHLSRPVWAMGERIPDLVVHGAVAALLAGVLRLFGGRGRLFLVGAAAGLVFLLARP